MLVGCLESQSCEEIHIFILTTQVPIAKQQLDAGNQKPIGVLRDLSGNRMGFIPQNSNDSSACHNSSVQVAALEDIGDRLGKRGHWLNGK